MHIKIVPTDAHKLLPAVSQKIREPWVYWSVLSLVSVHDQKVLGPLPVFSGQSSLTMTDAPRIPRALPSLDRPGRLRPEARRFILSIESRLESCRPSPQNWLSETVVQDLKDLSEFLSRRTGPRHVGTDWFTAALAECESARTAWEAYPSTADGQRAALDLVRSEVRDPDDSLAAAHMICAATNITGFAESASRTMRAVYLSSIVDGPLYAALRGTYVEPQPAGSSHLIVAPVYVLSRAFDVYSYRHRPASTMDWSVWRPVGDPVPVPGIDLELLRMVWQKSNQTQGLEKITKAATALQRAEHRRL